MPYIALGLFSTGLLLASAGVLAGDECIPRSPGRAKVNTPIAQMKAMQPVLIEEMPGAGAPLAALVSSHVAAGEYVSPDRYGKAGKVVALVGVAVSANKLATELEKGRAAAPGATDKARADLVAAVGATAPLTGAASATSIYADLKKASVDVQVGNKVSYENYTSAVGKTAAAIAGGMTAGPKGADMAVGGFEAAVQVGNTVTVFAQDSYFRNVDSEMARRADEELMARYEAVAKRRGVDLPRARYVAPLPGR